MSIGDDRPKWIDHRELDFSLSLVSFALLAALRCSPTNAYKRPQGDADNVNMIALHRALLLSFRYTWKSFLKNLLKGFVWAGRVGTGKIGCGVIPVGTTGESAVDITGESAIMTKP